MKRLLGLLPVLGLLACSPDTDAPMGDSHRETLKALASASGGEGPVVRTNKDDYHPGEMVVMVGWGFEPGEEVRLTLTETPELHDDREFVTVADSTGSFWFDEFRPEVHHVGVSFLLTARGETSGREAQATFTDAIVLGLSTPNHNGDPAASELSLTRPGGVVAGTFLIAQVAVEGLNTTDVICTPTTTTPNPGGTPTWTLIRRENNGAHQALFYRVADGTELATTNWLFQFRSNSGSCNTASNAITGKGAVGAITAYTGVDVTPATDAILASAFQTGGDLTINAPDIVGPFPAGSRVVRFFANDKDNVQVQTTQRIYFTQRPKSGSPGEFLKPSGAAADSVLAVSGNTGTKVANNSPSNSANWIAHTVVLKEAVAAAVTTIEVKKSLSPTTDPGLFDFTIAGTTYNNLTLGYSHDGSTGPVTVTPGLVTITEVAHTGTTPGNYTSTLACTQGGNSVTLTGNTGTSAQVPVSAGQVVVCTFTNTRNQGTIELKKAWSGTPGQTTLRIGTTENGSDTKNVQTGAAGAAPLTTGAAYAVNTGTYFVSETGGLTGYTSALACTRDGNPFTAGANGSVTVGKNEVVICTFTNTRDQGTIELKKAWSGTPGQTTLRIGTAENGSDIKSVQTGAAGAAPLTTGAAYAVNTGTYHVSETGGLTGYTPSLACTRDGNPFTAGASGSVTVGKNEVVICTFTNTRDQGTIELKKAWSGTPGQTTLRIGTAENGSDIKSVQTGAAGAAPLTTGAAFAVNSGTYYVSETGGLTGYTSSLACTRDGEDFVAGSDGSVSVNDGDAIICTFTNTRDQGTIELKKAWSGTPGQTTLRIGTTQNGTDIKNVQTGAGGAAPLTTGAAYAVNTGTYYVSETGGLTGYTASLACTRDGSEFTVGATGQVAVGAGEDIICTLTNTRDQGTIELKKEWKGQGGQTTLQIGTTAGDDDVKDVETGAAGAAPLTTGAAYAVNTGTYYVSESGGLTNYSASLACTRDGTGFTPGTNGAVTIGKDEDVICTFTNTRNPTVTLTVTPGSQQYSDEVEFKAALAPTGAEGTVYFYVNSSIDCSTVDNTTAEGSAVVDNNDEAKITWPVEKKEGSYTVTACFESGDLNFMDGKGTASLTVTPEDASITPDGTNVTDYKTTTGSHTTNITLKFNVFEKGTQELNKNVSDDWAPGDIDNATTFSAKLSGVNTSTNKTGACSVTSGVPAGYNQVRVMTCTFTQPFPVDVYEMSVEVGTPTSTSATDDFYRGLWEEGLLNVMDPNAALPIGGGWIPFDAYSSLNFGFSYSLQGGKGSKTVRGGMVALRRFTSGPYEGWLCRVKTNSLSAPTSTGPISGSPSPGYFSLFTGSNASYSCKDTDTGEIKESLGNQTLSAYVEDRGEPGRGVDKFWIRVTGKLNMNTPAAGNAVPLGGGNIQVPKPPK